MSQGGRTAVADCNVVFVFPDGQRVPGRISVQQPKQIDELEAQCVLRLEGLQEIERPISGNDTLQSLLLALRLASKLIAAFEQDGGQILHPTGEPFDLEPYFGGLLRPRAAFVDHEIEWTRFDVMALLGTSGLGTVLASERAPFVHWLARHNYGRVQIDCSRGEREVRRQLGHYLKWEDQFGYKLEEGRGSLDALRDGFAFEIADDSGLALELIEPEALWKEDGPWLEGLLAIASEHSRYHLALGRRFMTILYVVQDSPLIGCIVDQVGIPYPKRGPLGGPADWTR